METGCSIVSCKNYNSKEPGVVYFGLPRNPFLFRKWVEFANRSDFITLDKLDNFRICTTHFAASAFRDVFPAPSLKQGAVPTLNGPRKKKKKAIKTEEEEAVENIPSGNEIRLEINENGEMVQSQISKAEVESVELPTPSSTSEVTKIILNDSDLLGSNDHAYITTIPSSSTLRTLLTSSAKKKTSNLVKIPRKEETTEEKIRRLEETVERQKQALNLLRAKLAREKKTTMKIISAAGSGAEIKITAEKKRGHSQEAKEALLEIYSFAPHLYPKYSKVLNLPAKTTLKSWFPGMLNVAPSRRKKSSEIEPPSQVSQLPPVTSKIDYFVDCE